MGDETPARTPAEADRALAVVSLAVLLSAGTWFSGTAAIPALRREWGLGEAASAWLTIAVQIGFITGTLLYAALNLADVFNARRVFLISSLLGAACNAGFAWLAPGLPAALVLIQALGGGVGWRWLTSLGSASAVAGGVLIAAAVGDGPYLPTRARFDPKVLFRVFAHRPFRYTALGYFGHMWEPYALWSLLGFYLAGSFAAHGARWTRAIPLVAFATVAMGTVGCVVGGWISRRIGERNVALASLLASGTLCTLSGFAYTLPPGGLLVFLLAW